MRRCLLFVAACLLAPAGTAAAEPNLPPNVTLPALRSQVPAGGGQTVQGIPRHDGNLRLDGDISDWHGELPGFGGAQMYSAGELVYQDHLFDAYGADEGQDTQRAAFHDDLVGAVPELYRVDGTFVQYAPGELGVPTGPIISTTAHGGLGDSVGDADLSEVRLAVNHGALWLLARTTTMTAPTTAILLLLDTKPGSTEHPVGFNSGLKTTVGDVAVLITPSGVQATDLATGQPIADAGEAAYDPSGYNNAVEARLNLALLQGATKPGVAVAAGEADGTKLKNLGDASSNPQAVNVANVAYRPHEPAREWWDRQQALELYKQSMDAFFTSADLGRMADDASERYVPGPGYHEAIFLSTPEISTESGDDGIIQRYGVYLPEGYDESRPTPTQYWFHFRGGTAHVAAHFVPGVFWDMGEREHSIVITPHGRGTSKWYVGKSGVDIEQMWADSHARFNIDRNRTYIAGHSMGGWASWLWPVMHPDWFAGAFPASPPPTQGAWTGLTENEVPGCNGYQYDDYSPCYIQANGGDAEAESVYPLLDNLREVPYAIYQGTNDELVPVSGVTLMAKKLQDLGYRYRYYLFAGQEHYGPPAVDQWADGADYLHRFVRNPNPPQVTYVRSMVFENAIEKSQSGGVPIDFDLSHAYWMSGLQAVDPVKGIARFDGTSFGLPRVPHTTSPDADGPAKTNNGSPYTMVGQQWQADPAATPETSNGFEITLSGAKTVTLDLDRMKLTLSKPLTGKVTTDVPLELHLHTDFGPGVVQTVPAGTHTLTF